MKKMVLIPYEQYIRQKTKPPDATEDLGTNVSQKNEYTNKKFDEKEEIEGKGEVTQQNPEKEKLPIQTVLAPIGLKNKRKAETLLHYIKQKMDWNDNGELITSGVTEKGSHISDLLKHALDGLKNFNPAGYETFYKNLGNTPASLLHPSRRHLIGKGDAPSTSKTLVEEEEKAIRTLQPPPPGIPTQHKPVNLTDPLVWTNKWRQI